MAPRDVAGKESLLGAKAGGQPLKHDASPETKAAPDATIKASAGPGRGGEPLDASQAMTRTQEARPLSEPMPVSSRQVVDQIQEPLAQAMKKGMDRVQIRLRPEGLGDLRIDLRVNQGRVHLQIHAGTLAARQMIEAGLGDLRHQLQGQDLHVGEVRVDHRSTGEDRGFSEQRGQHHGERRQERRPRYFDEYFA